MLDLGSEQRVKVEFGGGHVDLDKVKSTFILTSLLNDHWHRGT